ncbi:hypothetical protein [Thermoactinospora rubra]|uniref:hypothetical protein n=1 Tax=Thermoactinospora rubra TaxID=1088767 RepID=UPI00117F7C5B|nr:hypothetical protein [Thermoactinospora rubra]
MPVRAAHHAEGDEAATMQPFAPLHIHPRGKRSVATAKRCSTGMMSHCGRSGLYSPAIHATALVASSNVSAILVGGLASQSPVRTGGSGEVAKSGESGRRSASRLSSAP